MGPCLRESSLFSIPISREHGSLRVCFWLRCIAIQTALIWAVLRRVCWQRIAGRSGSQSAGSDAAAFCAALSNQVLQTQDWEIGRSHVHAGKVVRDHSGRHWLRELPCTDIKARSGRNTFPQGQVACEIYDQMSKLASSLLFRTPRNHAGRIRGVLSPTLPQSGYVRIARDPTNFGAFEIDPANLRESLSEGEGSESSDHFHSGREPTCMYPPQRDPKLAQSAHRTTLCAWRL